MGGSLKSFFEVGVKVSIKAREKDFQKKNRISMHSHLNRLRIRVRNFEFNFCSPEIQEIASFNHRREVSVKPDHRITLAILEVPLESLESSTTFSPSS